MRIANRRSMFGGIAAGGVIAALLGLTPVAHAAQPGAGGAPMQLAEGPYATMEALLKKTMFNVKVARVKIRFDSATQQELAQVAQNGDRSQRTERAAEIAADAQQAQVVVKFEHDVKLDQFLDGAREDLQHARKADMISDATFQSMSSQLPEWFGFLRDRGFEEGDRLTYQVSPQAVRTLLQDRAGRTLGSQVVRGPEAREALMAGYFAPGTTFRDKLVRSLFRN